MGIFVLPVTLVSIVLVLALLGYYGATLFISLLKNLYQIRLVSFDVMGIAQDYLANFSVLKYISPTLVLFVLTISFTVTIFILSRIYSQDKGKVFGSFLMYALVYGPIFGVMWITTIAHKLLNLKIKW